MSHPANDILIDMLRDCEAPCPICGGASYPVEHFTILLDCTYCGNKWVNIEDDELRLCGTA